MERLTRPTGEQQQAFEKLREASNKAIELTRTACPTERPITPSGRLAAAERRLEILLEAVRTVRPALDDFYKTLSEEQKAHFYAAPPGRGMRRWHDDARPSLGDGRLDAWRDEMRRRWRERWSDDERGNGDERGRGDGRNSHADRPYRNDMDRDHRRWRDEGWRGDDARRRKGDDNDRRRSRDRDDDEESSADSWSL